MRHKDVFKNFEHIIAGILVILMAVVVISATLELGYNIIINFAQPPGLFLGIDQLFDLFGMFMMVLIAIELMASIHMYPDDKGIYLEMMFLIAITAVTRKIVLLDTKTIDPVSIIGLATILAALVGGYYVVRNHKASET